MDSDIKWKNIQRILTRTKKSSKIKVQSKKEKKRGETQMAVERDYLINKNKIQAQATCVSLNYQMD